MLFATLAVIVFGSCLVTAAWPLLEYRHMRSRFRISDRYSRSVLTACCAAMLCSIGACAVGTRGEAILFGLAVVGPLIALHVRAATRGVGCQHTHCPQCGYNLTGNVSGTRPECGRPIVSPLPDPSCTGWRAGLPRWPRVILIWMLCVVLLLIMVGYRRYDSYFVCPECACHESRVTHTFAIPFGGPVLFDVPGATHSDPRGPDPLTAFLDPNGQCSHQWVGFGRSYTGVLRYSSDTRLDPSRNTAVHEPGFAQFVEEHPDVLDRIRASLRKRERIRRWIPEEYLAWEKARKQDHDEQQEPPQP